MMNIQSMRSRYVALASAFGIAALSLTAGALPASASPATESAEIVLSWDGNSYTSVVGESFVGVPVAVPGDSAKRTLMVRNDGPSAGTLRASIINVKILDAKAPDLKDTNGMSSDQGNFYDDLRLGWNGGSASFTDLASRAETPFYEVSLAQGAVVPVTIDYQFPIEATSGNKANVSYREASFDVRLTISGETTTSTPSATPSPIPTPEPSASDSPSTPPVATPVQPKPPLANTGASIGGAVALGLGLLGVGSLFAARARRKSTHTN